MIDPKNIDPESAALAAEVCTIVENEEFVVLVTTHQNSTVPVIQTNIPECMQAVLLPSLLFCAASLSSAEALALAEPDKAHGLIDGLLANSRERMEMILAELQKEKEAGGHDKT